MNIFSTYWFYNTLKNHTGKENLVTYVNSQQVDLNKDGVYDKNDLAIAQNAISIGDLLSGQNDLNKDGVCDKKDEDLVKDIQNIQETIDKQNGCDDTNFLCEA